MNDYRERYEQVRAGSADQAVLSDPSRRGAILRDLTELLKNLLDSTCELRLSQAMQETNGSDKSQDLTRVPWSDINDWTSQDFACLLLGKNRSPFESRLTTSMAADLDQKSLTEIAGQLHAGTKILVRATELGRMLTSLPIGQSEFVDELNRVLELDQSARQRILRTQELTR